MTAGAMIRAARKAKGLTQRDLADAVKLDFTYISKIETETMPFPPSEDTYRAIAAVLDIDGNDVIEASGRWMKVKAADMAKWRRLGQTADAILAQTISYGPGYWIPADAINDLRTARTETER